MSQPELPRVPGYYWAHFALTKTWEIVFFARSCIHRITARPIGRAEAPAVIDRFVGPLQNPEEP